MVLAQHLHIPEYLKFFQEKVEKGDTVILDNGAYEGVQMTSQRLNCWVRELRPSVVVLPDAPKKFAQTVFMAEEYLSRWGLPVGTEGMTVLHAADGELRQFEMAYELVRTKWVGFSRLTKRYADDSLLWPDHRVDFAGHLKTYDIWRPELKHHALGMLNGNLNELKGLSKYKFDSCDSSAPIWRGLLGYKIEDSDWPNYEVEMLAGLEASNFELAERNLTLVKEACNG